jgi:hypothetical protein
MKGRAIQWDAVCHDCGWTADTANAQGLAAQHAKRLDTHKRQMRAAWIAAALWPILIAAVMFCEVLPWAQGMLAA